MSDEAQDKTVRVGEINLGGRYRNRVHDDVTCHVIYIRRDGDDEPIVVFEFDTKDKNPGELRQSRFLDYYRPAE